MATGASDIFTQDIEDFPELVGMPIVQAVPAPLPKFHLKQPRNPLSCVPFQPNRVLVV
jgi:hypothetical protein